MKPSTALIKELRDLTGAGFLECKEALAAHDGDLEQARAHLRRQGLEEAEDKAKRETKDGLVVIKGDGAVTVALNVGCETDFVARTVEFREFAHTLADQVLADPSLVDVEALLAATTGSTPVEKTRRDLVMKLGENITVDGVARYAEQPGHVVEAYIHAGTLAGYGPEEGRVGVLVELQADGGERSALHDLAHDLALHIAAANPRYVSVSDIPEAVLAAELAERRAELTTVDKPAEIKTRIVEGRLHKWQQEVVLLRQPFIRDPEVTVGDWLAQAAREIGAPVSVTRFTRYAADE